MGWTRSNRMGGKIRPNPNHRKATRPTSMVSNGIRVISAVAYAATVIARRRNTLCSRVAQPTSEICIPQYGVKSTLPNSVGPRRSTLSFPNARGEVLLRFTMVALRACAPLVNSLYSGPVSRYYWRGVCLRCQKTRHPPPLGRQLNAGEQLGPRKKTAARRQVHLGRRSNEGGSVCRLHQWPPELFQQQEVCTNGRLAQV